MNRLVPVWGLGQGLELQPIQALWLGLARSFHDVPYLERQGGEAGESILGSLSRHSGIA